MRAAGACLGFLAGSLLRVRRRHVEEALGAAGLDPSVAPAVYRSLGAGVFELLWLSGRDPAAIAARFTLSEDAAQGLRAAHARGRGVLVATAHTGNWDLSACGAARWIAKELGAPLTVVTKRLSWGALDRYWQRLRADRGVSLVEAAGAVGSVRDALRAGGVVAMLIDQAPERRSGVATGPFLGRPARHDLAAALLAARAKAPLLVMSGHRLDDGSHRLELLDVIDPGELAGRDAAERATLRASAAVDRFVRSHAGQWLWLHRRWK